MTLAAVMVFFPHPHVTSRKDYKSYLALEECLSVQQAEPVSCCKLFLPLNVTLKINPHTSELTVPKFTLPVETLALSCVDNLLLQGSTWSSITRLAFHNRHGYGVNMLPRVLLTRLRQQGTCRRSWGLCNTSDTHTLPDTHTHSLRMPYIQSSLCKHAERYHITRWLKWSGSGYIASIRPRHVMYLCNVCGGATAATCGWEGPPLPSYHRPWLRTTHTPTHTVIWVSALLGNTQAHTRKVCFLLESKCSSAAEDHRENF